MTPDYLGLNYDEWRTNQWNLITQAGVSKKKFILIEAPTGFGKSGFAMGYSRLLQIPQTHIVTHTRQQQDQYLDIAPEIRKVEGRDNFRCLTHPMHTAATAPCQNGVKCPYRGPTAMPGCAYEDQKREAQQANEVVFNYALELRQLNYAHTFRRPDVLILDEAHQIDDQLRSFISVRLRQRRIAELGLAWPRRDLLSPSMWHAWARDSLRHIVMPLAGNMPAFRHATALKNQLRTLATHLNEDWILTLEPGRSEGDGPRMTFSPTWVNRLAQQYLWNHTDKVILMSATMSPLDIFCEQLGIDEDEVELIAIGSTFPVKRRPLYYEPVGKVKLGDDGVLNVLARKIDALLLKHPHEKTLIHCVSYQLVAELVQRCQDTGRFLTHGTQDRAEVLEQFKASPDPLALLSPSMNTGVDLPYDQCRVNIIAKLPFPNKGDEQIKRRMKLGPDGEPTPRGERWYAAATAWGLTQAYGRGMRALDDECATYLLDANFSWFRTKYGDMLPRWLTDAIIEEGVAYRSARDLLRQYKTISPTPQPQTGEVIL